MTPEPAAVMVRDLFISPGHNFKGHFGGPPGEHPILRVAEVVCRAGRGLEGDRYFDHRENFKGQITFFDVAVLRALCDGLGLRDVDPAVLRRNVLVEGLDLTRLVGRCFTLQGVAFEGVEECSPCSWMDQAVGPGAHAFLAGRGGLRARILRDGILRLGAGVYATG